MTVPDANPASALARFLDLLAGPCAALEEVRTLLPELAAEEGIEAALFRFRQARRRGLDPGWDPLRKDLEAAAAAARQKRVARWHLGADRQHLRLRYARRHPAEDLNPAETLHALCAAMEAAGLPLALGLGKSPRPLVTLGHPLPVGAEGLEEWADVVLMGRPEGGPAAWCERLRDVLPEGLSALALEPVPTYATPVLELSREAHWSWPCPPGLAEAARAQMAGFLAADRFEIEKAGKAEGRKATKRLDVRPLVASAAWSGPTLNLVLRIGPGEALNPRKLLAGILGLDPAEIAGLLRTRVVLAEDKRIQAAEKFEPKLRNIFEDAVVLGAGSNITLVDEDDEEPLRLG